MTIFDRGGFAAAIAGLAAHIAEVLNVHGAVGKPLGNGEGIVPDANLTLSVGYDDTSDPVNYTANDRWYNEVVVGGRLYIGKIGKMGNNNFGAPGIGGIGFDYDEVTAVYGVSLGGYSDGTGRGQFNQGKVVIGDATLNGTASLNNGSITLGDASEEGSVEFASGDFNIDGDGNITDCGTVLSVEYSNDAADALTDGATITIPWGASNVHTVTLGGARTLTFGNSPPIGRHILKVRQDATGGRTLAFNKTTLHSNLDIDTIAWQSDNIMRLTFNGTPDLSTVLVDDVITVSPTTYPVNAGTFRIIAVNDGSDYVDIINLGVSSNAYDEDDSVVDIKGTIARGAFKSPSGVAPVISPKPYAETILEFVCFDGAVLHMVANHNMQYTV